MRGAENVRAARRQGAVGFSASRFLVRISQPGRGLSCCSGLCVVTLETNRDTWRGKRQQD